MIHGTVHFLCGSFNEKALLLIPAVPSCARNSPPGSERCPWPWTSNPLGGSLPIVMLPPRADIHRRMDYRRTSNLTAVSFTFFHPLRY